jgi:hypothetical protein
MESAFRTVLSAAGVMAACYVLAAASWIQVLLLFSAACLGWCVYTCKPTERKGQAAGVFHHADSLDQSDSLYIDDFPMTKSQVAPAARTSTEPERPTTVVYRFPIHKLSATSLPLPEPGS